jgi:hypothetical protein
MSFRDSDSHRYTEARLTQAGILYSVNSSHRVCVSDDVRYSLRCRNGRHPLTSMCRRH